MKLIIAIIQPSKLEDVKAALSEVEVVRLTIMDVKGFGRQKGQTEVYRGHEITVNLLRKVQLQIAVNDHFVEPTINAIIKGGRSGSAGEIGASARRIWDDERDRTRRIVLRTGAIRREHERPDYECECERQSLCGSFAEVGRE